MKDNKGTSVKGCICKKPEVVSRSWGLAVGLRYKRITTEATCTACGANERHATTTEKHPTDLVLTL